MKFFVPFSPPKRRPKRWPLLVLSGVLCAGLVAGGLRLEALVREQLPALLRERLQAALGREVRFGEVRLTPLGIRVEALRVPRVGAEAGDPLTAERLRVGVDWWRLLTTGRVRVTGVGLERARFRFAPAPGGPAGAPWTAQLVGLSRSGIGRFALVDSTIEWLRAPAGPAVWAARGIGGELRLADGSYAYQARVASLESQGQTLRAVRLVGTGDAASVTLTEATAQYREGRLHARGRVESAANDVDMTVRVEGLRLGRLAPQMGIPAEWAMQGRLTGEVTIDVRHNLLRSVRGTLQVERGSLAASGGARFPWRNAEAKIDWTPARTLLHAARVIGEGVELTADGRIVVPAGRPLTEGRFELSGAVTATRREAIARVAELLALRETETLRWSAEHARIRFRASGVAGALGAARASGHVEVSDLRFQPVAGGEWVHVARLEAEVERGGAGSGRQVLLRNVRARTEGLTLTGEATVEGGPTGRFEAQGVVEARDLHSLRAALPQATLWKWVPVISPEANGALRFRLSGPTTDLARVRSEGTFEVRDFRLGAQSSLPNAAMFFIPVRVARGEFRQGDRRLTLSRLELEAATFTAAGQAAIDFRAAEPALAAELRLRTEDWRALPAMPAGALPELQGGAFEATLAVSGPFSRLGQAPVEGTFRLTDAVYTPGRANATPAATPVPVRLLAARFRWAQRVLELPEVTLDTPVLAAAAHGQIFPQGREYRLALDVTARTGDAGALAARFQDEVALAGGTAEGAFHLAAPIRDLSALALEGSLRISDATLQQRVELLGRESLPIRSLEVRVARQPGSPGEGAQWRIDRLALDAPGVGAELAGALHGRVLDAELRMRVASWQAPASAAGRFPVEGGAVALAGRLQGDLSDSRSLRFAGEARLEGARPRYRSAKFSVTEGALNLVVRGDGAVADPLAWMRSGEASLEGARVALHRAAGPAEGAAVHPLRRLTARFERAGDGFRIEGLSLESEALTASGSGFWSPQRHEFAGEIAGRDLERLGLKLPSPGGLGPAVGRYRIAGTLSGTPESPVADATARVELMQVRFEPPAGESGGRAGLRIALERLAGRLRLAGGVLALSDVEGNGPAGTLALEGEWAGGRLRGRAVLSGNALERSAAALGIALPEGVAAESYRLTAEFEGTPAAPALRGSVELTGVRLAAGGSAKSGLWRLDRLTATLHSPAGSRRGIRLADLVAAGPAGVFTGSGELRPDGSYRLALASPKADPALVRQLLPGTLEGGALAGTLNLEGSARGPLRVAHGRFELTDGVYTLPEQLGLLGEPLRVARFAGDYRWENGRTTLTGLELDSHLLDGTGALAVAADGRGSVRAELATTDLGRIAEFWPLLVGRFRGGSARGTLEAAFDATGMRGTLALRNEGGLLILPNAPAEFAEHPVERASGLLAFEPGRLTFRDVKVRGPKGNADGEGVWTLEGPVYGKGKAWFSKSYTSKLLKPTGWGWLAKLVGIREIKSDFTLSGTSDRVMLNAAITRSLLWKFAKGRVPKEFQAIAAGKVPLWVQPVEVAEAKAEAAPVPASPPSLERRAGPGAGKPEGEAAEAAPARPERSGQPEPDAAPDSAPGAAPERDAVPSPAGAPEPAVPAPALAAGRS